MRTLFIILVLCSCSKKLIPKKETEYAMPKALTAHDSVYLYQAQKDLNEMKQLSKNHKNK